MVCSFELFSYCFDEKFELYGSIVVLLKININSDTEDSINCGLDMGLIGGRVGLTTLLDEVDVVHNLDGLEVGNLQCR